MQGAIREFLSCHRPEACSIGISRGARASHSGSFFSSGIARISNFRQRRIGPLHSRSCDKCICIRTTDVYIRLKQSDQPVYCNIYWELSTVTKRYTEKKIITETITNVIPKRTICSSESQKKVPCMKKIFSCNIIEKFSTRKKQHWDRP